MLLVTRGLLRIPSYLNELYFLRVKNLNNLEELSTGIVSFLESENRLKGNFFKMKYLVEDEIILLEKGRHLYGK